MHRPIAGILTLLAMLSCDRSPDADTQHFRFINRGDIFTLDLNRMSYEQDFRLTYAFREGLYSPTGENFAAVPAGASGVDLSADKRVYTFHLRPEARWTNGDPVVANDYLFSWRYMLENPGDYTSLFYCIKGAEAYQKEVETHGTADASIFEARALDDHTLQVTLTQPVTYFLELVAFPPFYPRHERSMRPFAKKDPANGRITYETTYTRPPHVVTNGAFELKDWQFKRVLKLERSLTYWDAAHVKLAKIDNIVNDNVLSEYLQFKAGAVDWVCGIPGDISPDLRSQNAPGLQTSSSFGTFFLTLNCRPNLPASILGGVKNPLADTRVRQALALAIDKSFITDQITRLGEKVADEYVPAGTLPGFTSLPGLHFDVDRARALLADAGYPQGKGFPKLPILNNAENNLRGRIAQSLKQQWRQNLGIDIEIEGIEGRTFKERVSTKEYAIATVAWFGDYADVSTFTDKYLSTSLNNDSDWQVPEYDALLSKAAMEGDAKTRFDLLQKAEAMINTQVPIIPIYYYVNATLIGPRVKGVWSNARNMVDWKTVSVDQ